MIKKKAMYKSVQRSRLKPFVKDLSEETGRWGYAEHLKHQKRRQNALSGRRLNPFYVPTQRVDANHFLYRTQEL